MKRRYLLAAASAAVFQTSFSSHAGGMAGGATELTQLRNEIELMLQYATQVEQYLIQLKQLQHDIANITPLVFAGLSPDVANLIQGVGSVMTAGKAMGSNMVQLNTNYSKKFKNSPAATLAANFKEWHETTTDTLEGALKTAGLHNQLIEGDTAKIQALYDQASKADGNVKALHALAQIATTQVEHTQRLGNLISTQNIAVTTYMAAEMARDQAKQKAGEINFKAVPLPDKSTYKNPTF